MTEDFNTADILELKEISTGDVDICPINDIESDIYSADFSNRIITNDFEDTQDYLMDISEDMGINTLDVNNEGITEVFKEDMIDFLEHEEMADIIDFTEDVNDDIIVDEQEVADDFFEEDTISKLDMVDDFNGVGIENFVEDIMEDISATDVNDFKKINDLETHDIFNEWEDHNFESVLLPEQITDALPENSEEFIPSEVSEYTMICDENPNGEALITTVEDNINKKINEISDSNISNEHKVELLRQIKDDLLSEIAVGDGNESGPVKVLRRNEMDLLSLGNKNIDDILSVKFDDYCDKGYSEEEISSMLANDKIELQRDFLQDVFHGEDVLPAIFNQEVLHHPFQLNDLSTGNDSIVEVVNTFDTINEADASALDVVSQKTESYDIDPYIATSNSEIQIFQSDAKIKTLEQVQREFEGNKDIPVYDVDPYVASSNSERIAVSFENVSGNLTDQELLHPIGDIKTIEDVSRWLLDINPNYDAFDPESPYCNNCGSCAYAVYQRFEGNPNVYATENNIGYNSEMEALTGMKQIPMSPTEIEQRLLAEGDGAHAIIGIDRAQGPGHWFNAACLNGKVVAIDGQSGEVMDWPPDYGDVVNWEMSVRKGA